MIDFKTLVKAGVHFGHQTSRWSPRMAPYIWGYRNGVHLIDVSKTATQLERAAKFLEGIVADRKQVLFVGTKKPAQKIIRDLANKFKMPYVTHRWIGGTLTNHLQVKKSVTKLLHMEDVLSKSGKYAYTKKELNTMQKQVDRLEKSVGGVRNLKWPVSAVVLVDVRKEQTALKEAACMGIPVVALVDTNSDPSIVDYVIPANDDSPKSIQVIMDYLAQAVDRGLAVAATKEEEAIEAAPDQEEKTDLAAELQREDEDKEDRPSKKPASRSRRRPAARSKK